MGSPEEAKAAKDCSKAALESTARCRRVKYLYIPNRLCFQLPSFKGIISLQNQQIFLRLVIRYLESPQKTECKVR